MTKTWWLVLALAACGSVKASPDARAIDALLAPTLSSIAPTNGIVSTSVTLTGANFGATQGTGTVTIGGMPATVTSWADGSITTVVPNLFPGSADVKVTNAVGMSGAQPFKVILPPMVYVADNTGGASNIAAMTYDPSASTLTQAATLAIGTTSSFGGCTNSLQLDAPHRRLYGSVAAGLLAFDINAVTGALTPVSGSPFASGSVSGYGIAINAAGTRVYQATLNTQLPGWAVAADGTITALTGSPFTAGVQQNADIPVMGPNDGFLYLHGEAAQIGGFSLDATGAPTALAGSPFTTVSNFGMDRRKGHDQFIATGSSGLEIWQPGANGVPAPITGSPFALTGVSGTPNGLGFTGDGNRVYVGVFSGAQLYAFDLAANGTPTAVTGSPFASGLTSASCLAVSADSTRLFMVDNTAHAVGVFTLATSGTPTAVTGSPFAITGITSPAGLAITF